MCDIFIPRARMSELLKQNLEKANTYQELLKDINWTIQDQFKLLLCGECIEPVIYFDCSLYDVALIDKIVEALTEAGYNSKYLPDRDMLVIDFV